MAYNLKVQFDDKLSKIIGDLAKEKGISKPEILRRAIATYIVVEKEIAQGRKIIVQRDGVCIKELILQA